MNKTLVALCFLGVFVFSSCKKDEFNWLSQSIAEVPVTVENAVSFYNGIPYVQTSLSGGGNITIKMTIPASTGRTIKQITSVSASSTSSSAGYATVRKATGLYNTAPIPGSGNTVTFTTSLAEYTSKTGLAVTASGTATSFLARYFYFLITLDNGQELLPMPVRVYVAP